jgi:hypothetical protein
MDKFKMFLFGFIFYLMCWLFTTLFVWWVGHDTLNLNFEKSSAIVLSFYACSLMVDTVKDKYTATRNMIEADRKYKLIIKELEKIDSRTSEQKILDEYRRTFGQNQGDLN